MWLEIFNVTGFKYQFGVIFFSILWLGFATFWTIWVSKKYKSGIMTVWGSVFICVGILVNYHLFNEVYSYEKVIEKGDYEVVEGIPYGIKVESRDVRFSVAGKTFISNDYTLGVVPTTKIVQKLNRNVKIRVLYLPSEDMSKEASSGKVLVISLWKA